MATSAKKPVSKKTPKNENDYSISIVSIDGKEDTQIKGSSPLVLSGFVRALCRYTEHIAKNEDAVSGILLVLIARLSAYATTNDLDCK